MTRLAGQVGSCCVASACVVALGCGARPDTGKAARLETVKVAVYPFITYAPFFIAEDEGFFREQGVKVEISRLGYMEATAAVVRGELDVNIVA